MLGLSTMVTTLGTAGSSASSMMMGGSVNPYQIAVSVLIKCYVERGRSSSSSSATRSSASASSSSTTTPPLSASTLHVLGGFISKQLTCHTDYREPTFRQLIDS